MCSLKGIDESVNWLGFAPCTCGAYTFNQEQSGMALRDMVLTIHFIAQDESCRLRKVNVVDGD